MVQNYDLRTAQTTVDDDPVVDIAGSAVPVGMKRYITYIKYCNLHSSAQKITVADGADAVTLSTKLDVQQLAAGDTIMFPDSPDPEKPIMCVEGGNFLVAQTDNAAGMEVTVQYYDE